MDFLKHLTFLIVGTAICSPVSGYAQFTFSSPGPLAQSHAKWDGAGNCSKCHEKGKQVVPELCLDCHKELAETIRLKKGYHGRMPEEKLYCSTCHPDHVGRDFQMIKWEGGKERFDHSLTGYDLKGKHAAVKCDGCHKPPSKSYLGLSVKCLSCHADIHRGQFKAACETCHDESDWKKAPLFNHQETDYPLEGKHLKVPCKKCHETLRDPATNDKYLKMNNIQHESCENCHKDVHEGRFGKDCESCHTPKDWKTVSGKAIVNTIGGKRKFHDKTKFPLLGAHAQVQCKSCHGPFPGRKAKFKGLAFERCTDCHADAHLGQIALSVQGKTCERCHTLDAFIPTSYGVKEHASTRYPLEGAHAAVPCSECHAQTKSLKGMIPQKVAQKLRSEGRPLQFSAALFRYSKSLSTCETCHKDPHWGQFTKTRPVKKCETCHTVASFKTLRFDHDRDSRYPLTGKHRQATCASCHKTVQEKAIYRGLTTKCDDCHDDIHVGQFVDSTGQTRCDWCHTTDQFKPKTLFNHNDPRFSSYPLIGKHVSVKCEKCHLPVPVAVGQRAAKYKPLPKTCEGCHVDPHHGKFEGTCNSCHVESSWFTTKFDHSKTGFPLLGAHSTTRCRRCHAEGDYEKKLGRACVTCHKDVHAGQLGSNCTKCHDETNWKGTYTIEAHRRTNFPLTGRHAMIPCEECHLEAREKTFSRVALECFACHQTTFSVTASRTVDHLAFQFPTTCQDCHSPTRWKPARFAAHDICFRISGGPHSAFSCTDCHATISGFSTTGQCATGNTKCTLCHTGAHAQARMDNKHKDVAGYQYRDSKCLECHRIGLK